MSTATASPLGGRAGLSPILLPGTYDGVALPLTAGRQEAQPEERLRPHADVQDRGAVTRDLDLAEAAVVRFADGLRRQQGAGQLLSLDGEVNQTGARGHRGEVGEERLPGVVMSPPCLKAVAS
jgi:hypothetical protein